MNNEEKHKHTTKMNEEVFIMLNNVCTYYFLHIFHSLHTFCMIMNPLGKIHELHLLSMKPISRVLPVVQDIFLPSINVRLIIFIGFVLPLE